MRVVSLPDHHPLALCATTTASQGSVGTAGVPGVVRVLGSALYAPS